MHQFGSHMHVTCSIPEWTRSIQDFQECDEFKRRVAFSLLFKRLQAYLYKCWPHASNSLNLIPVNIHPLYSRPPDFLHDYFRPGDVLPPEGWKARPALVAGRIPTSLNVGGKDGKLLCFRLGALWPILIISIPLLGPKPCIKHRGCIGMINRIGTSRKFNYIKQ